MSVPMNKIAVGIKEYLLMAIGMFLYSFGWIGCILPAKGVGGGAAGLSLVICHALKEFVGIDLQIGTMVFIINGLLLLAAGFIVGWNFGIKTIFSVTVLSVAMNVWQTALDGLFLFEGVDNFLVIILGGIFAGCGVAICLMQGGSTGGTDIVAAIINNYHTVSYGRVLLTCDLLVIGSSLLVGYQLSSVIYGYVMTAVLGYTVDLIMAGNHQSSQVMIFTPCYEKVAATIVESAHRGVTLLDSEGGYSHTKAKVVVVVCRKRETSDILKLVKSVDPHAFISVGSVMGVYGKGFDALNKI